MGLCPSYTCAQAYELFVFLTKQVNVLPTYLRSMGQKRERTQINGWLCSFPTHNHVCLFDRETKTEVLQCGAKGNEQPRSRHSTSKTSMAARCPLKLAHTPPSGHSNLPAIAKLPPLSPSAQSPPSICHIPQTSFLALTITLQGR